MRATVMYGAGEVRVEDVPDARVVEPTDALIRVTRAFGARTSAVCRRRRIACRGPTGRSSFFRSRVTTR